MFNIDTAKVGRTYAGVPCLYLHKTSTGSCRWVFRYSRPHKAGVTEMSLGPASQANFHAAQLRSVQLRAQIADGVNPVTQKRAQQGTAMTFSDACIKWIEHNKDACSASWMRSAKLLCFIHGTALSRVLISYITEDMIRDALLPLYTRTPKQARLALDMWKRVFDFAGRRFDNNPAVWKGKMQYKFPRLPQQPRNHFAALPYFQVPAFIGLIQHYQVRSTGCVALEFLILTATRTSETLKAEWSEFDLENRTWTIPGARTKTRKPHRIPLCDRAMELLKRQADYRVGDSPYVFFGYKGPHYPLAEKSMIPYLRMEGATESVHGFRASFKTWATEQTDHPRELIEMCLAHQVGNQVEQAYQRGDALERRRKVMNEWGEFCQLEVWPDDKDYEGGVRHRIWPKS